MLKVWGWGEKTCISPFESLTPANFTKIFMPTSAAGTCTLLSKHIWDMSSAWASGGNWSPQSHKKIGNAEGLQTTWGEEKGLSGTWGIWTLRVYSQGTKLRLSLLWSHLWSCTSSSMRQGIRRCNEKPSSEAILPPIHLQLPSAPTDSRPPAALSFPTPSSQKGSENSSVNIILNWVRDIVSFSIPYPSH